MSKHTVVAFDFDGTITRKDTLIEFVKFTKGRFWLCLYILFFLPLLVAMKLKLVPNELAKEIVFSRLYKDTPLETFDSWCLEFKAILDGIIYPKALNALKSHKEQGHTVIIISASMENWIKPWADAMGIEPVLATKIETSKGGLITGRFSTRNCYGQEKVNRLLEVFPDRKKYTLIAYGDSVGDKELIEFSDEGHYDKFKD